MCDHVFEDLQGDRLCVRCGHIGTAPEGAQTPGAATTVEGWQCKRAGCEKINMNNYGFCAHCKHARFRHLVGPAIRKKFVPLNVTIDWNKLCEFSAAQSTLCGLDATSEVIALALFPVFQQEAFGRPRTDLADAFLTFAREVQIPTTHPAKQSYIARVKSMKARLTNQSTDAKRTWRDGVVEKIKGLMPEEFWHVHAIRKSKVTLADGLPAIDAAQGFGPV